MCSSAAPIKSNATALNELRHGILINVACLHKGSLLESTGFSFPISRVGLGVHDAGAVPLLTQAQMHSLRGPRKGRGIVQVTSTSTYTPNKSQLTANATQ